MTSLLQLSPNERAKLTQKGIDLSRTKFKGEGKNRVAFETIRKEENQLYPVTIYVPKTTSTEQSPNAIINREKHDMDLNEYQVLRELGVKADSVQGDGRRINIVPFPANTDLEKYVQSHGPLKTRGEVQHIIGGMLKDLENLSARGFIHRDLKPDNIFLQWCGGNYDGEVGDYQLTGRLDTQTESPLPTRGTGTYAHSSLLNAWVTGKPAKSSERTEVSSFGKTLYFMLTGKPPTDVAIVESEDGKEIDFSGKKFKVALVRKSDKCEQKLDRLDEGEEEQMFRQMRKDVPEWAQDLVYRCLTDDSRKSFKTFNEVRQYYDKLTSKLYDAEQGPDRKFLYKLGAVAAGIVAGMVTFCGPNKESLEIYNRNPAELTDYLAKGALRCESCPRPRPETFEFYQSQIAPRMNNPIKGEEAR